MRLSARIAVILCAIGFAPLNAASAETVKVSWAAEPYPPFTSPDASGKWQGWEVDFMNAVCTKAKLDCVITPIAWDGIIPALTSKKIDLIISSMTITDERLKTIDFSDKYYDARAAIVGPRETKFDATPKGLKGKLLGLQVASIHQRYAQKHFADSVAGIKEYQTLDEAQQDLVAGRIDAIQADSFAMVDFLKTPAGACCEIKGYAAKDESVLGHGVGVGLRKGETELKGKINTAIKAIRADGTYQAITKKYFDFDIYGD
ncbi:transporter substrate-binding domain-containing protein [Azospirillum sp. YIM B02556]|uniref:Transporter substrate-binding domain-containing protein n=1 Tax=Azospirillum endophyticum TaxID=2800326 RepID=A0ABS1FFU9_9PROT|nr:transporter substrate-binding domain-containing protein [Azospirillum endophyticum]MBK1842102.1 transporter substrate-binding domain-containing protein [Azospirillum endophyticum]